MVSRSHSTRAGDPGGTAPTERPFGGFKPGTQTRDASIPPGQYVGYLANITELKTQFGWTYKLWWELPHPQTGEVMTCTELAPIKTTIASKFMKRLAAINGLARFEEGVELADQLTAGSALVHTELNAEGFTDIIDVTPLPRDSRGQAPDF